MTNQKHTPGPWTKTNRGGDVRADGEIVAQVGMFVRPNRSMAEDVEEGDANANLIASAPDLLAALRALITMAESEEIPNDEYEAVFDTVKDQARVAIAKAEGVV